MIFDLLKRIFGTQQTRTVRKYFKIVQKINQEEEKLQALTDEQVRAKTVEFRARLKAGETVDELMIEAYAVVKNVCRRLVGTEVHISGYNQKWDMVPYDVQIVGAIAMHNRTICEMDTGEGKTLTSAMPVYLHGLTQKGVHVVTVNDYLAKRDCEWNGVIFSWLGLNVRSLTNDTPAIEKQDVYKADVIYGTASEFGFDYLRDNSMAQDVDEQCQRSHYFAIIDEVDSILIDEARTPLIISGPAGESRQMYDELKEHVSDLVQLQKNHCQKLAQEAKGIFEKLGLFKDLEEQPKLSKEETKQKNEAIQKLWMVSKGVPTNKILRQAKELPDIRVDLENLETYLHSDINKEERIEFLSDLYLIIDERSSDFELTDKGIHAWKGGSEDFTLLDLTEAFQNIDAMSIPEEEKMKERVKVREEDSRKKERAHNLRQLFRSHLTMEKDVDYIIQDKKIIIIDEHTGRPQPGRRFSDGLHQAIEAKENLPIQRETQTYATVTLQNYFRMYERLAGMTGTAQTEATEFKHIYKLEVLKIPTNRPCQRKDLDDEIYMTEREKFQAILKDIQENHKVGRPVLVGTETVEASEKFSRLLQQAGLDHHVLNAKQPEKEAEIIALAGQKGAITVSTNMAGRGTDIKLAQGVEALGGLYVIGTTRHQSRRIDRQLRGRSGRQGDKGSSKFFISFEDSLMRLFTSPKLSQFLARFRPPEGESITGGLINRSIETAQKRVEQRNYSIRKHTLEYDDVMNLQRQEVYQFRNDILKNPNPFSIGKRVLEGVCSILVQKEFSEDSHVDETAMRRFQELVFSHLPINFSEEELTQDFASAQEVEELFTKKALDTYVRKLDHEAKMIAMIQVAANKPIEPSSVLFGVLRNVFIRNIDHLWQQHLLHIDHLRTEVSLCTIAQKDPLLEFKHEAFRLFNLFREDLYKEITHALFSLQMMLPNSEKLIQTLKTMSIREFPSFISTQNLEVIEAKAEVIEPPEASKRTVLETAHP
ncbi:MAG: preprotein translocase subunit SecA [Chlamydiia bacterium]